jgi:hypothetical protein
MLADWDGVHSFFNPGTPDQNLECTEHKVCSERTALSAYVAALYGDDQLFNRFLGVWVSRHMNSGSFAQWLLDPDHLPIVVGCQYHPDSTGDCFRISSGDDLRMLEALVLASCRFPDKCPAKYGSYRAVAERISGPLRDRGSSSDRGIFLPTELQGASGTLQVQQCEWPVATPLAATCFSPNDAASLNVTNPWTLRLIGDWLGDDIYSATAKFTADILHHSQDISTRKLMFWPQFKLKTQQFCDEGTPQRCAPENGTCHLVACLDIAARLAAFRKLARDSPEESRAYFGFLVNERYRSDGVLFGEYFINDGAYTSSASASFPEYLLFAKLAIELGESDWALRALRDHVLFDQVRSDNGHPSPLDPFQGAIKSRIAAGDADSHWLLETLVALHQMRSAATAGDRTLAPRWRTVARCTATTAAIHDIFLNSCVAKGIKVLCRKRHTRPVENETFDFSIHEINLFASDGTANPLPHPSGAFASSIQGDAVGRFPARLAFDGETGDGHRWASQNFFGQPLAIRPEEWIYGEFEAANEVRHVTINWEAAFAAEYELQVDVGASATDCTLDVASTGNTCAPP